MTSAVIAPNSSGYLGAAQFSDFPTSLTGIAQDLLSLAREHSQNPNRKIPVVGIAGSPGVGKTSLAYRLVQKLNSEGVSCVIVHFDDWTNPEESRQEGYFNLKGVHEFFAAFLEGRGCIEKPVVNEFTGEHATEILDLRSVDLILFEGLLALSGKETMDYSRYCDRGIFVEASEEDISAWKRARPTDVPRTNEEFEQHIQAVFAYHRENIEPFKSNASWIVHKDRYHNYSLLN